MKKDSAADKKKAEKDTSPAPKKDKKAESHHLKPKDHHPTIIKPEHHEMVEMMPAAAVKPQQHKMTAKEIADLRVQHGIQYEREHNVDHYITEVTHPSYEITGWAHDEH